MRYRAAHLAGAIDALGVLLDGVGRPRGEHEIAVALRAYSDASRVVLVHIAVVGIGHFASALGARADVRRDQRGGRPADAGADLEPARPGIVVADPLHNTSLEAGPGARVVAR